MMQFKDLNKQYQTIKSAIDTNIQAVITSSSYISGPQVKELESLLSSYVGVKHCISCGNGTDAITIALRAITYNLETEERKKAAVFVPDFTFFSTGECPADLGFPVYFVDVDSSTYNIDPDSLEVSIKMSIKDGYVPSVLIAVDLFGLPAQYPLLRSITDKYNIVIIEDAAQGFGGAISIDGRKRMACSFGDIATTSFFPAKPLGCYGDGGAIFTNDDIWANLCRSFAVHGKDTSDPLDKMAKYNNVRFGYNSRLDTIQAAVLLAKFPVFRDKELSAVNEIAEWYKESLESTDICLPFVPDNYYSSWAQYTIQLQSSIDRDVVQAVLKSVGIPSMVYYKKPMHLQEAFSGLVRAENVCPNTMNLCKTVLCLPIHPYLVKSEVDKICEELKEATKSKTIFAFGS